MSYFSSTVTQDGRKHRPRTRPDLDEARDGEARTRHAGTSGDGRSAVAVRARLRLSPGMDEHASADARARISGVRRMRPRLRVVPYGLPTALVAGDVVALVAESLVVRGQLAPAVVFGALAIICRAVMRQYRRRLSLSVLDDLPRLLGSTVAAVGVAAVWLAAFEDGSPDVGALIQRAAWFLLFALVGQALLTYAARLSRTRRHGRRTIIVGGGRVGNLLVEALLEHKELGLEPVGVLDPHPSEDSLLGRTAFGTAMPVFETDIARLADTVVEHEIDTAILALEDGASHVDTVIALHQTGCETLLVPPLFEMHHDGPDVERVRGVPLIRLRPDPTMRLSWWVKRGFDVAVAALGLLVLSPLLLIVAALVLLDSGRPVLFWQERVGLDGRIFRLCKFRSMRPESEVESQTTWNIAADPRVGRVGHLLRRSSIDEIPQLWNILCGQMSLVGPRPERPTFVERFSAEHERYWARHRVPVGLTGLAQVNGLRGDTSIRDRARFDNYYIANWSLWLDVKIMLLTAREVLGGRGR